MWCARFQFWVIYNIFYQLATGVCTVVSSWMFTTAMATVADFVKRVTKGNANVAWLPI